MLKKFSLYSLVCCGSLMAELKLPAVFSDHMVLQREMPVPVWGWADPNSEVEVSFADQKVKATTDGAGRWKVELAPLKASAEAQKLTCKNKAGEVVELNGVLVGEVWFASGQSNMQWNIDICSEEGKKLAKANSRNELRIIQVPRIATRDLKEDFSGKWQISHPDVVGSFTAVGWNFGAHLQEELKIPVGIIHSSWGGARIEPWISDAGFQAQPDLKEIYAKRQASPPPLNQNGYGLYNAMVHPVQPFAVRGFLWYQGESNRKEFELYPKLKKALIESWRKEWNRPDAPFYFVQLAPFTYGKDDPEILAKMWQAQERCLKIPHTGMVVTTDVGNLKDIHPKDKVTVGQRLANLALNKVYKRKNLVADSPLFNSLKAKGDQLIVSYGPGGTGLKTRDGQAPNRFEIAGEDGIFHPATATILPNKTQISLSSPNVKKPRHARFAWGIATDADMPNLVNSANLPAGPFMQSL